MGSLVILWYRNILNDYKTKQINMKKINIFFIFSLGIILFTACSEDAIDTYHAPGDNVYFNINADNKVVYSFTDTTLDVTEVALYLPVKLAGERVPYERTFNVEIIDTLTTAQSGLHYLPLSKSYALAADSGTFLLPVTLLNKDEILLDSTLTIGIRLLPSDELGVGFPLLLSAKISFSSRLEKPDWWDYWGQLGTYSRTKHFLFLISSGTKALHNPSTDPFSTPKALYHISLYENFLRDPASWVAKNPEYALDKQADGNYLFYLKETPDKTYPYVYESANGKYYFKDENGEYIYV